MKGRNNKGFTLIELLVTITILGIITVAALPSVRRVQATNRTKRFDAYSEGIENAAKAYVDSYENDMFKTTVDNGCATIYLADLNDKKLIKDIKLRGTTCAYGQDTRVQVSKVKKKYYYQVFLRCRDKNTNKVQYQSDYYDTDSSQCISQEGGDDSPPTIKLLNDSKDNRVDFKKDFLTTSHENRPKIKIRVRDDGVGMNTTPDLNVIWTFNGKTNDGTDVTNYRVVKKGPFKPLSKPIVHSLITESIDIPEEFRNKDWNGKLRVTIQPVNVEDASGNKTLETDTSLTFYFDNLGPELIVTMWKWKDLNTSPNRETTGLEPYTENTWLSGKVLTKVEVEDRAPGNDETMKTSDVDEDSITFTTTGRTENLTNHKATFRNIEAQGKSQIKYHACDKLGNCSDSRYYTILLDRKAPTCNNSGGDATWVQSRTITGTCVDTNGNIEVSGCAAPTTVSKTYTTNTNITNASPGRVRDNAGNEGDCPGNQTVHVDVVPPTCTNSYSAPSGYGGGWTKENVTILGTCSDDLSGCQGNASLTFSSDMNVSKLSPGTVRDLAGNEKICTNDRTVKIDKTAPKCTWDPNNNKDIGLTLVMTSQVTVTCSDPGGSGCKKTTIKNNISYSDANKKTTTAGTVEDNVGNTRACPLVRPYSDSDCKYVGKKLRTYKNDSINEHVFFLIDINTRPDATWLVTPGFRAAALNHMTGYRRYRYENGQYKVCFDVSLDIMYETTGDVRSSTPRYDDNSIANNTWPGIGVQTTG